MAENNEDVKNEDVEEKETEDNREEETSDEIRDNDYVNNDEVEMLRSMEKRFDVLNEKIDNMISMFVDAGSIERNIEGISENEQREYEEDFIDIDEMDLSL